MKYVLFYEIDHALGVFTTRAAAEEYAIGDPFVLNGVVRNWHIREWLEAIATP
jgi:hypothetical protein